MGFGFDVVLVGSGFFWVFLAVDVLGGGFLWVRIGFLGFFALFLFSVFFIFFSSFRHSLVYFLCTRVAPLYAFDLCNITYQKKKKLF